MDYRRTYWLLFVGAGALYGALQYLDYLRAGRLTAWTAVTAGVAAVIVVASAYAVANPDRAGGPTEPTARFALAVVAFLLMVVLVGERLILA